MVIVTSSSLLNEIKTRQLIPLSLRQKARTMSGGRSTSSEELIGSNDLLSQKWVMEAKKVSRALKKDPQSLETQYRIGCDYLHGTNNCKESNLKAYFWISMAADGGHPEAQYLLGYWHVHGIIVSKNYEKAVELLSKSASQKHTEARRLLIRVKIGALKLPI